MSKTHRLQRARRVSGPSGAESKSLLLRDVLRWHGTALCGSHGETSVEVYDGDCAKCLSERVL